MRYENDAGVWEMVRCFENCEYSLAEFDHARHLATGLAYLAEGSFDDALARMRVALRRFSAHHAKMGYHETITRFWLLKAEELRCQHPGATLCELSNAAAESLADKDLIFRYYQREVLESEEARRVWVPPVDAQPKVR